MHFSPSEWQQEVERLGPGLYRYFCGSFSHHTASDLVQETFVRLVQKSRDGSFQASRGTFKSYAYGIARMIRLEAMRDSGRFALVDDERDLEIPIMGRAESDRGAHLRWAIGQLRPIEQEVLLLLIDEEFQLEEIAAQLETPLGTLKSHVHRAKERLRELMESEI